MRNQKKTTPEVSSGSMADIAFLLLIFFLVTTSIVDHSGLLIALPEPQDDIPEEAKIPERNLFNVRINSNDELMLEGEVVSSPEAIRPRIREFILNPDRSEFLADSPGDAVVSLQSNRGTSHGQFIAVLDQIQGAYFDIYSERAGVSNAEWRRRTTQLSNKENLELYKKGRGITSDGQIEIPMKISIAEPTN